MKQLSMLIMIAFMAMFTGCASYVKTALVHEQESVRIDKQPFERIVFTMPNGHTFILLRSGYYDGTGSLLISRVENRSIENHNFNQSGGLIDFDCVDDEKIKIGSEVYGYSVINQIGKEYEKFRIKRRVSLVPFSQNNSH